MGIGATLEIATRYLDQAKFFLELPPRDPPETGPTVILRSDAPSLSIRLHVPGPELTETTVKLLRSRRDWLDIPGAANQVQRRCVTTLAHLGLAPDLIESIARAETLQVTIAIDLPTARQFPWEFVLAEATRPQRRRPGQRLGKTFLVARHLTGGVAAASERPPVKLLVVESAPGPIGIYNFETERRAVASSLELVETVVSDPDLPTLTQRVTAVDPDIIHLAGVDTQQGADLLGTERSETAGMYLHINEEPAVVSYKNLAPALLAGQPPHPVLVSFNMYNSSEGAAEVVARGARASIGFQDEVDDEVAETFFGAFYGAWKRLGFKDLGDAFRSAWLALGGHAEKVRGTGIVLWSGVPLVEGTRLPRTKSVTTPEKLVRPDALEPTDDPISHFNITYKPPVRLNYSMLHNNANIVPVFTIQRQKSGVHKGIAVEVKLSAGVEQAVYKETFSLHDEKTTVHVHERVRVALTAELSRSLDEAMRSTVYATVRWGDHVLMETTDPVEFLPADEWRYDALNCRWLPSFVFPRDPVVRQIVDSAQRYLVALRDDSSAGFDGYQSYEPNAPSMEERCRAIDAQVQALWWAIVYDHPLAYINPPPSFGNDAQRLRTPSEVIQGRRGTCIDLTLLLAACLEYVEIHPVLFLLNDHAFPGYWRSEASYANLIVMTTEGTPTSPPADTMTDAAWMLGKNRFADVAALVQQGHIIPLESVSLTSRSGFWTAVEEGLQNLRSKRHFDSMFDVKTARKSVTPLPLWSKRL